MAKKPETKVDIKDLIGVAENFNTFMFDLKDGIDTELEYDELLAEIKESAGDLVAADTISAATADTLKALKIKFAAQVADPEEDADKDDDNDSNDDADDKVPEPVDTTAAQKAVKKAKETADVRTVSKQFGINIPPPYLKDLDKMKEYVIGKLKAIAAGEVAGKKEKKEKVEKSPSVVAALREIICEDATISFDDLTAQITKMGFTPAPATVRVMLTDTRKIIEHLQKFGRLKK